ncbi:hypothetical protein Taro_008177 [Colocasia esculenta]|uniref:Uncharacterized protein n=1 Tax=Colocasia esculenta TaxID=4460 RepID=A0A843U2L0_COLES|nr:hypothetical protein [Colocasia esculenta]
MIKTFGTLTGRRRPCPRILPRALSSLVKSSCPLSPPPSGANNTLACISSERRRRQLLPDDSGFSPSLPSSSRSHPSSPVIEAEVILLECSKLLE